MTSIFLTNTEYVASLKTKPRQRPLQKPGKGIMGEGSKLEGAAELTVELLNASSLAGNVMVSTPAPHHFWVLLLGQQLAHFFSNILPQFFNR